MNEREFKEAAEAYIDRQGLRDTLQAIADVCFEKAEHVRNNWQDKVSAAAWKQAARNVEKIKMTAAVVEVSR